MITPRLVLIDDLPPPEPLIPPPPTFGEVRVNGVEITPEAIAEEIQHHPAHIELERIREHGAALEQELLALIIQGKHEAR